MALVFHGNALQLNVPVSGAHSDPGEFKEHVEQSFLPLFVTGFFVLVVVVGNVPPGVHQLHVVGQIRRI